MLKPAAAFFFLALAVLPSFAEAGCPVINGTFLLPVYQDGKLIGHHELVFATRQERGVFSYSTDRDGNFQVADGKKRPIRIGNGEGTVRFECQNGSVFQESKKDGSEFIGWKRLTPLGRYELKVETNFSGKAGIYQKQI